jgi:hypothetical protein
MEKPRRVSLRIEKRGRKWLEATTDRGTRVRVEINEISQDWQPGQSVAAWVRWEAEYSRYGSRHSLYPVGPEAAQAREREAALRRGEERGWITEEWAERIRKEGSPEERARLAALKARVAERRRAERMERALGILEELEALAQGGFWPDRKAEKIRELVGEALDERLEAARRAYEGARAARAAQETQKVRYLVPLYGSYPLHTPVRLPDGRVVVFEGEGKVVRISENDPSAWGAHLLGHEGERGFFQYGRLATPEETAALEAKEQAAREAARLRRERLEFLRGLWREVAQGENLLPHAPSESPFRGETETISWDRSAAPYGTEFYLVLEVDPEGRHWLYAVSRNGADGDDWSLSNTRYGITWRRPSSAEEHRRVREAFEALS